ncbi:hypothetical protein GCM10007205_08630 [Oxalicibacterium flavum]|uniref:Uncharacterized protein n=1 Tax=Oxalicibacterium flavum TaxID=179467 RepID=A0A8J2UK37_9BURK|nr:hypothetical protein [Oxalicibacterium flavum]GGC01665.1 hypothetical protein GCM10007205_08630 [Oxalicibacterium flavum]
MKFSFFLLPALLAATAVVHAEGSRHADPADASQAGALPPYRSAFDNYLPHTDPSSPSLERWRAANDEVGRLGGHAGHIDAAGASAHDHSNHVTPKQLPPVREGGHHHAH